MLCDIANRLPVSQGVWKKIILLIVPFIYVMSPFGIGVSNAYKILTQGGISHDNILKVKSHRKFASDALALIIVQISILGYMTHAHGFARAISCWIAYLFGNGLLFVTFS